MKTYELSVFFALISGAIVVHVFSIEVSKPISWVKEHADEMAVKFFPGVVKNYCALMVKEAEYHPTGQVHAVMTDGKAKVKAPAGPVGFQGDEDGLRQQNPNARQAQANE